MKNSDAGESNWQSLFTATYNLKSQDDYMLQYLYFVPLLFAMLIVNLAGVTIASGFTAEWAEQTI